MPEDLAKFGSIEEMDDGRESMPDEKVVENDEAGRSVEDILKEAIPAKSKPDYIRVWRAFQLFVHGLSKDESEEDRLLKCKCFTNKNVLI